MSLIFTFKRFFILIILILASILWITGVAAQESEELSKKYGVSFPISELGGCKDMASCRTFCEDPVNYNTCVEFGKSKGIYKEEQVDVKKKEGILNAAKSALGCDSYETCKAFCQIPSNFELCDSFAKRQGIVGGHVEDPKNEKVLEKAQEVLGCNSYTTCASFCSDPANQAKCSEFAKQTGLKGGERPIGPGGCTSESSCKAFCSDPNNYKVCQGFTSSAGGQFRGPGGCTSEESCKSYCQQNPGSCRTFSSETPGYNPAEMCSRTPRCTWSDNSCQCSFSDSAEGTKRADEYAKYCRENPGKCTPGGVGGYESNRDRLEFERYCKDNPEKCRPAYSFSTYATSGENYDPAKECVKYNGCNWIGNSCQCTAKYYQDPATGTSSSSEGSYDPKVEQEKGCKAGGGTCDWSQGYCYCKGYQSPYATTSREGSGSSYNSGTGSSSSGSSGSYTSTGSYSSGSSMTREQQESTCRAGGGTCSWNGDICNCQGYTTPTSGSTSTSTSGSSGSYSGTSMSREQQESGCRSCGGTCNWNGDMCQCQCASSGSTTSQSTPAPAPTQEPTPEPASSPATQGVSTVRGFLQLFLDWLRN